MVNMRKDIEEKCKLLIQRYIEGIYNYLEFAYKSPLISNDIKSIHLGFRTITHIFHTNYIQTGDVDVVYLSMQKGYLYYLEFLEQIEENNMRDNFNHTNAILFVHSKALVNYSEDNRNQVVIDDVIIDKMKQMSKLMEIIFWWDNPNINQSKISINIFKSISNMIINTEDLFIPSYFEFAQRRIMNHEEYMEFIECSIKLLKETIKTSLPNLVEWEKNKLKKYNDIELKTKELSIRKWCKWVME